MYDKSLYIIYINIFLALLVFAVLHKDNLIKSFIKLAIRSFFFLVMLIIVTKGYYGFYLHDIIISVGLTNYLTLLYIFLKQARKNKKQKQ